MTFDSTLADKKCMECFDIFAMFLQIEVIGLFIVLFWHQPPENKNMRASNCDHDINCAMFIVI